MIHIPILRHGVPYKSLDVVRVPHHRTGEPFVEISQANGGLIRRDLREETQAEARRALAAVPFERLLGISVHAAQYFLNDTLPLGDTAQSPDDYVRQLSATTGMPYVLVRRNMAKIGGVLTEMRSVLRGLTRGLDLSLLDAGHGEHDGYALSFYPRAQALGIVLPSNSPGVHSLWAPAIPLKMPLVLKPGSAEPWTPFRIAQAFMKAGCPPEAFSYYPADHAGAGEILRRTGRSVFFGDVSAVGGWEGDPRVELHGPGYSKVLIGDDRLDEWEQYVDLIAGSIADNGGRSCVNASGVWVAASHAERVADALSAKLARIVPRAADDEEALLAPFADPRVARRISQQIDAGLHTPGAREVTASHRGSHRLASFEGCTYLQPTVVLCENAEHPLANREFLFPFAAVVKVSPEEMARMPASMGKTLVVTALTRERALVDRLLDSPLVDRLNVGPIATNQISWDQPHEGNLFEHLYARRSFQATDATEQHGQTQATDEHRQTQTTRATDEHRQTQTTRATDEHGQTQTADEHGQTQATEQHRQTQATEQHRQTQTADEHGRTQATDEHRQTQTTRATEEHGQTQTADEHGQTQAAEQHRQTQTADEQGRTQTGSAGV